ncbi:MAG: ABC transporter substrate-binding protein [bacterium]
MKSSMVAFIGLVMVLLVGLYLIMNKVAKSRPSVKTPIVRGADAFPLTVTDVFGEQVKIPYQPQHIISMAPAVTETLYALGRGKYVIADTTFCDYPEDAKKLPHIGGYLDPNIEQIIALKPDLIIGMRGNMKDTLEQMHKLYMPLIAVDPTDYDSTMETIKLIGQVVGESPEAEKLVQTLKDQRAAVTEKIKTLPVEQLPRTLYLFELGDDLYSAGPGSHIDQLITLAGGKNIAGDVQTPWPKLSLEKVIADDPQAIIVLAAKGTPDQLTADGALNYFRGDERWANVSAVKDGRVAVVEDDLISRPGSPRQGIALQQLAAALHPDLFPAGEKK